MRDRAVICALTVVATALAAGTVASASSGAPSPRLVAIHGSLPAAPTRGTSTPAGAELRSQGYLVADQAQYQRDKAAAAAAAPAARSDTASSTQLTAAKVTKWAGVSQPTVAPSDSTGAVGPSRYVELVNDKFGIYDRTATPPGKLSTGTLLSITGDCKGCAVTDPQVIWDPDTNRFYYTALDFTASLAGTGDDYLLLGFSKGSDPNGVADWCQYLIGGFGLNVPDYPKLGDTSDFWMIGSNLFDSGGNYTSALVDWITKPAGTGTFSTCPDPATFTVGATTLANPSGGAPFTPVAVNQIDGSSTGYVIALPHVPSSSSISNVLMYTVTNSGGSAAFSAATAISVGSYSIPPAAPESGSTFTLDTLDGRFTQAVGAIDPLCHTPAGGPAFAVWTQHTVAGGAGSQVRWDEINTSNNTVCQSGATTSTTLDTFNGAVSPDRLVNGTTALFGSDMVLGYNTSSATTDPTIVMASSVGHAALTAAVKIVGGAGPYTDGFTCPLAPAGQGLCRWGDYSAATPDPSTTLASGSEGQVWLTNMFNAKSSASGGKANWKTENWAARP